jgi:formylglycine-generating enzyme required for sulfatase activity
MVAGRRALEGRDASDLFLATGDLAKRPTLRARGAHVSDAVEAVVARALAVDPRRRFATARDFWDALVASVPELTPAPPAVRHGPPEPLAARPPGLLSRAPAPAVSTPPPPRVEDARLPESATEDPPEEDDGRTPWAWFAVAALAVIVVAIVVAKVGRSAAPRPPALAPSSSVTRPDEPAVRMKPFLPEVVRVPAGTFTMGSDKDGKGERPAHPVAITRAFYIDRTEVTAEKYATCVEDGACAPGTVHGSEAQPTTYGCNGKDRPRHPANCVDRAQAEAYCKWAQKRLPTEAEWEYAARGSDAREYPWGNAEPKACTTAILTGMTGPCGERKGTWEVGTAADGKSPFGALDMAGNVWEWVADGYEEYPADASAKVTDPRVPLAPGGKGVLRGGSWDYSVTSAKATYRLPFPATGGNVSIGFRCAMDAAD